MLDHRITANDVGTGMLDELLAWMHELPGTKLAEYLIGGLEVGDLPFKPVGPVRQLSWGRMASSCRPAELPFYP